jgi:hypothetical protein
VGAFGLNGAGEGALFAHPARQEGLRVIAYPLVEQSGHLATDVGGVVQARKLKALQRSNRRVVEEIPRRGGPCAGDGVPRCQLPIPYT